MKLIPALVPLCALVLTCALPAETFEGTLSMKMTSANQKDGPQTINFSLKEGLMRTDVPTKQGTMSAIFDTKNHTLILLMPQQRMYMERELPQPTPPPASNPAAANPSDYSLQDTGVTETILGYSCKKFIATGPKGSSEIWVTDQLGSFFGLYHGGGPGRRPEAAQAWETALAGRNFFPLRVVTTAGGKGTFRMDVTAVDKQSLPNSLFTAPAGWTKFDLGAIMGGAMQGGFPGGRPGGSN
jgi:hypothetical protein